MSELTKFDHLPIEPVYQQSEPNETISLGRCRIKIEGDGSLEEDTASAAMRFNPDTRLEFVVSLDGKPPLYGLKLCADGGPEIGLQMLDRGTSVDVLFSETRNDEVVFTPKRSGVMISGPSQQISSAVFHLFNFPGFLGPDDFTIATGVPPLQG
jgi:hypothetical protein